MVHLTIFQFYVASINIQYFCIKHGVFLNVSFLASHYNESSINNITEIGIISPKKLILATNERCCSWCTKFTLQTPSKRKKQHSTIYEQGFRPKNTVGGGGGNWLLGGGGSSNLVGFLLWTRKKTVFGKHGNDFPPPKREQAESNEISFLVQLVRSCW